jgi:hypothetical protein
MQVQDTARVKENATFNATKWMCVGFKEALLRFSKQIHNF